MYYYRGIFFDNQTPILNQRIYWSFVLYDVIFYWTLYAVSPMLLRGHKKNSLIEIQFLFVIGYWQLPVGTFFKINFRIFCLYRKIQLTVEPIWTSFFVKLYIGLRMFLGFFISFIKKSRWGFRHYFALPYPLKYRSPRCQGHSSQPHLQHTY